MVGYNNNFITIIWLAETYTEIKVVLTTIVCKL